jgi:Tfp pilus assembly protein PilF
MDRITALTAMLAQDPGNTLARYGLAMEYKNRGELANASREFDSVLKANPNYAAAYFHGGQTFEQMGMLDEAREIYERGIEVTSHTGDSHTRAELQGALDLLP